MRAKIPAGLFINCVEAQDSIYESGRMVFQCLAGSERYSLDYAEINPEDLAVPTGYDFYFFNYHAVTMSWLDTGSIRQIVPGLKITMVLEVSPNDPFVFCPPEDFDAYCVLDPTLNINRKNVFPFPRPLEIFEKVGENAAKDVPVIGSFGFATRGKGFEHVVEAVNKEFDRAIVRINIPFSSYADVSRDYAETIAEICRKRANEGIDVIITHDFMNKRDLIKWCSENTLNCFLYDRNMPGLAATTDQAISSGRPLIFSKNDTFRHVAKFIKPYPEQTLREAIENTGAIVAEIQKEWSPQKFRERFEEVLGMLPLSAKAGNSESTVSLRLNKSYNPTSFQKLRDKMAIKSRFRNFVRGNGFSR